MEQRAFVKMIHAFRRRMNIASVLQKSIAALCIGAAAGILFQAAALVVPFLLCQSLFRSGAGSFAFDCAGAGLREADFARAGCAGDGQFWL